MRRLPRIIFPLFLVWTVALATLGGQSSPAQKPAGAQPTASPTP